MSRLKGGKFFLDLTLLGDLATLSVNDETTTINLYDVLHDFVKSDGLLELPQKQLECKIIYVGTSIIVNPVISDVTSDGTYYELYIGLRRLLFYFNATQLEYKELPLSITRESDLAIED